MQGGNEKRPRWTPSITRVLQKRKESGQIKSVSQLTKRETNLKRRQARIRKRNQRARHIILDIKNQFVTTNTPPITPEAWVMKNIKNI